MQAIEKSVKDMFLFPSDLFEEDSDANSLVLVPKSSAESSEPVVNPEIEKHKQELKLYEKEVLYISFQHHSIFLMYCFGSLQKLKEKRMKISCQKISVDYQNFLQFHLLLRQLFLQIFLLLLQLFLLYHLLHFLKQKGNYFNILLFIIFILFFLLFFNSKNNKRTNNRLNYLKGFDPENVTMPIPSPILIPNQTPAPVSNSGTPSSATSFGLGLGTGMNNTSTRTPPNRPGRMPAVNINSQKESTKRDDWY